MQAISEKLRLTANPLVRVSEIEGEAGSYCEDISEHAYQSAEELLDDLRVVQDELYDEHGGLFADRLENLMMKVRMFGFHFASMDIRQDSRVHTSVVAEVVSVLGQRIESDLDFDSYEEQDTEGKIAMIESLEGLFPLQQDFILQLPKGIARDTVQSLRAARMIQESNGVRGVHRYIISNTRDAANVLEVWLLAQCAGWHSSVLELDIVPLFETIADLDNAARSMERLYRDPVYAKHLERRGSTQTIMLGFSDGTKDGGYVTANWQILRAKQRLTSISRDHGVQVIFFDGRGGPPARGGGNTHKFYRSLGDTVDSEQIHLTVQGQTISSKYGTHAAAEYNMEQLVSAGLENNLFPSHGARLDEEDQRFLDELSERSQEAYLNLKNDPRFIPYLEEMTPLHYYGMTNIASRPTSRNTDAELNLDNLRAIPFVGAWSQMKQNIPGFYGFGSGLEHFMQKGDRDRLRSLYRRSLFFRTLVENSMQSLSKTNYALTRYMASDERFGDFWQSLADEAQRTKRHLCEISGESELLENDPTLRDSIQLREDMILPILTIQQYALRELRKLGDGTSEGDRRETLEKMVVKSLAAAVNASRNAV
jgi:phosphoenolpyruvate carboxylase